MRKWVSLTSVGSEPPNSLCEGVLLGETVKGHRCLLGESSGSLCFSFYFHVLYMNRILIEKKEEEVGSNDKW
jgi:hypothetical protein